MKRQKVYLKAVKGTPFLSIHIPEQWHMKYWLLIHRSEHAAQLRINPEPHWLQKENTYFSAYKCTGLLREHIIAKANFHNCIFLVQKAERDM